MSTETYNLNAMNVSLKLPDFEGFTETLEQAMEDLSNFAPFNRALTVDVSAVKGGYKVAIRLASQAITLLEDGVGRSPFFALEQATQRTKSALKKWAIGRRL